MFILCSFLCVTKIINFPLDYIMFLMYNILNNRRRYYDNR